MNKISHLFSQIKLTTPIAIIIGSIIIATSILAYGFIMRGGEKSYFKGLSVSQNEIIDGKKDSKAIVILYSDPECPYCATLFPTMKELREKYKNEVTFVYRHLPLISIHPHAMFESKAIQCVYNQEGSIKAYEFIDLLYGYKIKNKTTQLPNNWITDNVKGLLTSYEEFNKCLSLKETEDIIYKSLEDAGNAEAGGTPSTFILRKTLTGKYEQIANIDGARDIEYFEGAIKEALGK